MAVSLVVQKVERGPRRVRAITYAVTFTGNYASPLTLDFTSATNPKFQSDAFPSTAPDFIGALNDMAGYGFDPQPGTANNNSTMKIYSAGGTELSVAAFPAGVLAGTLYLRAEFTGK